MLASTLAACRPLYAERPPLAAAPAPAESAVASSLAAVEVVAIQGRVGVELRNELIFAFTGGGSAAPAQYRLAVAIGEAAQSPVVDPFTDRPELETLVLDAAYVLTAAGTGEQMLRGNAFGRATYLRTRQRYATVRALRDAEDRAAKIVARQILSRLQAHFAQAR